MENNNQLLQPDDKSFIQKQSMLRNEFIRPYIPGGPMVLSLFLYFSIDRIAWWAGIAPAILFALFLRDSTLNFLINEIEGFKIKLTIYILCLLAFVFISFFSTSDWPVLIMIVSLLWFSLYFEKAWGSLQIKYNVKPDEWFRK